MVMMVVKGLKRMKLPRVVFFFYIVWVGLSIFYKARDVYNFDIPTLCPFVKIIYLKVI